MNLGLRCGQLLAERADIKRMNIVERTRLWYRLERIGTEPIEPEQAPSPQVVNHYHFKFYQQPEKKGKKSKYD